MLPNAWAHAKAQAHCKQGTWFQYWMKAIWRSTNLPYMIEKVLPNLPYSKDYLELLVSWYDLLSFLSHLCLSPAPSPSPSNSIHPRLPAFCCLCSNSKVYSCNYAMSTLGLASD